MAFLTPSRAVLVLAAVAICGGVADGVRAQGSVENDVKAAYLFNFTKFAEWPQAEAQAGEPFRVCVMADSAFSRSVDATIAGESVLGRPLVRLTPQSPEAARNCQLLYIGAAERERGPRVLAAVRDRPVLTVGDWTRFLDSGGTIQFVVENNRVRFDINPRAAGRSGIRLSSKLLRVARTILEPIVR